ncbi:MAG: hypothetical protein E6J46_05105 [Chloroflexi bacterium]|nr:MAG: hypothetical protein E6J46_05105 [Chloroflexota bacterium]
MIVVCGEALIDVIHNDDGTQRAVPGGGPFNTARALARLGVPTAFLGRISNDVFGRQLAELLVSDGASLELASIGSEATTIAVADVDSAGFAEYQFLVQGTSAPNLTPEMLPERLGPTVEALHLGTLGLVLDPMASTLVDLVHRERDGRVVIMDPDRQGEQRGSRLALSRPNLRERRRADPGRGPQSRRGHAGGARCVRRPPRPPPRRRRRAGSCCRHHRRGRRVRGGPAGVAA